MKFFRIYFSLLALLLSGTCLGQEFIFKDITTNSINKDYKKILIAGMGSVETRHFLETLSSKLIAEFKSKGIESEFYYFGKDSSQAILNIKKFPDSSFDAVILFSPASKAYSTTNHYSSRSGGQFNTVINSRILLYTQDLEIRLYEPSDQNTVIRAAYLNVGFEPGKQYVYSRITKKFIASLKTSLVLH